MHNVCPDCSKSHEVHHQLHTSLTVSHTPTTPPTPPHSFTHTHPSPCTALTHPFLLPPLTSMAAVQAAEDLQSGRWGGSCEAAACSQTHAPSVESC